MFRVGKVLKVKVELSPDAVGFGRATIVEADGSKIYLHIKTSRGEARTLPKGTRIWFVSDMADNPFNGLWSTAIIGTKIFSGKTAMECSRPKFEALVQKRRQRRVSIACAIHLKGDEYKDIKEVGSRNISRSGVGIEIQSDCADQFPLSRPLEIVIASPLGEIPAHTNVVNARYNWLANRTDIGLEFMDLSEETSQLLDKLLISLGGKPKSAPPGKEADRVSGPLSGWLKSSRDHVQFVRSRVHDLDSPLSDDDLDELEPDEAEAVEDEEATGSNGGGKP